MMASTGNPNYNAPFNLNPLSYASIVIGFISFAFTLLTLLRVTWGNIVGLWEAPDEIRYTFANLKSALYEERAHCRVAWRIIAAQLKFESQLEKEEKKKRHRSGSRKGHRRRKSAGKIPYSPTLAEAGAVGGQFDAGGSDDSDDDRRQDKMMARSLDQAANWKVLYGSVKRLCKQFSDLERPFLKRSVVDRQQQAASARKQAASNEKRSSFSEIDTDEDTGIAWDESELATVRGRNGHYYTDDYLRDYASFDLSHRIMWLRIRSSVDGMGKKLQEVQIRRSSAEISQVLRSVSTIEHGLRDLKLIQDQRDRGGRSHHGAGDRRRDTGERWERVHVRRTVNQDD